MADLKIKILMEAAERISAPFKRAKQSTDKMREAMKSAADGVKKLEQAQANVQAFARLKREAQANAAALAAAQEKARGLALALEAADGGTKKARAEFARAGKEVERLRTAQEANARDTATMRARLAEAGVSTRTLAADQRRLRRDLDAAREAAMRQAKALDTAAARTKALAAARAKLDGIRGSQASLAISGAAGMAAGGGALAVGSRMAGAGIAFGEQMSAVGAVARLDKNSAEFKALADKAKELGANTSFSASEAAAGMQKLAMAGFNAEQMLASMPGMVRGIQAWVTANPVLAGTLIKVAAATAGLVAVGGVLATVVAGLLGPFAMARFALTTLGVQAGFAGGAMALLRGGFGLIGTAATTVFPMLITGMRAVGAAFLANPIGIVIAAIAAAAYLIYANWEPIKEFFVGLWEGITSTFSAAWDFILAGIERIRAPLAWVSEMWGKLFGGDGPGDMPTPGTSAGSDAPVKIAPPPSAGAQVVSSDNPRYEPEIIPPVEADNLRVIGQVIWHGGLMK